VTEEIHDHSRVVAFMAARRRAMVLHALWRPMLAGAVGAALVIACAWVAMPRFTMREVEVPRIALRDVTVPNIVQRDVTVDRVVPKDVEIEMPRFVAPAPSAAAQTPAEASSKRGAGDGRSCAAAFCARTVTASYL